MNLVENTNVEKCIINCSIAFATISNRVSFALSRAIENQSSTSYSFICCIYYRATYSSIGEVGYYGL